MYYPFLRGRLNELSALKMLAPDIVENGNILPVVEPVNVKRTKLYNEYVDNDLSLIIIVNPRNVGGVVPVVNPASIDTQIIQKYFSGYSKLEIGIIINSTIRLSEIQSILNKYSPTHNITLIHFYQFHESKELFKLLNKYSNVTRHIFDDTTSQAYQSVFDKEGVLRVLLKDSFAKKPRNKDYPRSPYLFSDIHKAYEGLYDGFGDFTITGNYTGEGGSAAEAVAIHFPFIKGSDIMIQHFVSDRTIGRADTPGKFMEANGHLNDFLKDTSHVFGIASSEFKSLHKKKHFPGLGVSKRLSMVRHIEVYMQLV